MNKMLYVLPSITAVALWGLVSIQGSGASINNVKEPRGQSVIVAESDEPAPTAETEPITEETSETSTNDSQETSEPATNSTPTSQSEPVSEPTPDQEPEPVITSASSSQEKRGTDTFYYCDFVYSDGTTEHRYIGQSNQYTTMEPDCEAYIGRTR